MFGLSARGIRRWKESSIYLWHGHCNGSGQEIGPSGDRERNEGKHYRNQIFIQCRGRIGYTIRTAEGQEEVKTVEVPQNYRLEVEQFGRCIDENEKPGGYGRIFAEKCETC